MTLLRGLFENGNWNNGKNVPQFTYRYINMEFGVQNPINQLIEPHEGAKGVKTMQRGPKPYANEYGDPAWRLKY